MQQVEALCQYSSALDPPSHDSVPEATLQVTIGLGIPSCMDSPLNILVPILGLRGVRAL